MSLTREAAIQGINQIISNHTNVADNRKLLEMSENILESGLIIAKYFSTNNTANDIDNLLHKLTAQSDTFVRKILSGASLGFALGLTGLPAEIAGTMTGEFIKKTFSNFNSDEKTSVVHIMREVYVFAKG